MVNIPGAMNVLPGVFGPCHHIIEPKDIGLECTTTIHHERWKSGIGFITYEVKLIKNISQIVGSLLSKLINKNGYLVYPGIICGPICIDTKTNSLELDIRLFDEVNEDFIPIFEKMKEDLSIRLNNLKPFL